MKKEHMEPLFLNPLEPFPGLSIDDLNRYLPAVQKADDIKMTIEKMAEGLFLADAREGLMRLPENSIDLIITAPPQSPWRDIGLQGQKMTLQEYYTWNNAWLKESFRVLKMSGAIYLLCGWRFSGMYHALLNNQFRIQTRITWRDREAHKKDNSATWNNEIGDIWFATKSADFAFNRTMIANDKKLYSGAEEMSNLWLEYFANDPAGLTNTPNQLIKKILEASSFKLNWVVDPFMRQGSVGKAVKNLGRRFIGFETNQDNLLIAMKQIDKP